LIENATNIVSVAGKLDAAKRRGCAKKARAEVRTQAEKIKELPPQAKMALEQEVSEKCEAWIEEGVQAVQRNTACSHDGRPTVQKS
jgi:hypothetical protein